MGRPTLSLQVMYRRLATAFGPQHWWPADSAFEMMVGAILTQATNWHNVEQAIARLRQAGALSPRGLLALTSARLRRCVRPAGYFRQKATRLRQYARWYLRRFNGRPERLFAVAWPHLRAQLLELHGVGPETADSILLYAGEQPVFVVDAYTQRIFRRHGLIDATADYDQTQRLVMQRLRPSAGRYKEFHALLVAVGKRYCRRRDPHCESCPLGSWPHTLR